MKDENAVAALAALGNGLRSSIWRHLLTYGADGLAAGVLGEQVGLSASALSFHLRSMTAAGLLQQRRNGRQIFYSIDFEMMTALRQILFRPAADAEVPPAVTRPAVYASVAGQRGAGNINSTLAVPIGIERCPHCYAHVNSGVVLGSGLN